MTQAPLTRRFANWSIGFTLSDAPSDVRRTARRAILDTLGVMAAGGAHPKVRALASGLPPASGRCTVLCRGPGDAETAALVNGMASHVWDFDDTSYTGIMHGSAVVLPVALALAEERGATEEDLIAAFIAGSEVTYTLADICTHDHYFHGWWSTVTLGLIGATAAAARLLRLTTDQATHAIGLAAASASGGKSVFGTDGKGFLVGETARRAITFARTAQIGLTGPTAVFEDPRGFLALLNRGTAAMGEADTLGRRWRLTEPGLLFKTSPVCSAAHAAIEQMASLMEEAGATADDIVSIKAEVPELVQISLVYPRPATAQEAQFSLPYALACAALHGRVRLDDLSPRKICAAEKAALMARVSTAVAPDLSTDEMRARYPESARLTVTLGAGRVVEGFCGEAYGMPRRPLTDEDLHRKFTGCIDFAGGLVPNEMQDGTDLLDLAQDVLSQCGGALTGC
jgi:2-methylcitrate dehydratase PrpD